MSRYLGLDLSFSSTGFYMIQDNERHVSFEIDTSPHDFSGDIERADYIARYIVDRIKGVEIDLAVALVAGAGEGAHRRVHPPLPVLRREVRDHDLGRGRKRDGGDKRHGNAHDLKVSFPHAQIIHKIPA